jgi:uncharacterized protein YndB with AHSA1/START domain
MSINQPAASADIVKTIEIQASQMHVFDTFVSRIADWWPLAKFSRSRVTPPQTVIIEPRNGGGIYEVTDEGEKLSWGSVRLIEPHSRIVMEWHLGRPVSTEVEVEFEALSARLTRVRLVHRGWEKLQAAGATVEREGYEQGWAFIFEKSFATLAAAD